MNNLVLLIDADNANPKHIDVVISELKSTKYGTLKESVIFGDWSNTNLNSWNNTILRYALKQNQQNSYVKGKNATDMALVIYAMEILYTKPEIDTFAIMSSDSDFTPLAQKLRQMGKKVIGFVGLNTSVAFQQVCNKCVILDNREGNSKTQLKNKEKTPSQSRNTQSNVSNTQNNSGNIVSTDRKKSKNNLNHNQNLIKEIVDIIKEKSPNNAYIKLQTIAGSLGNNPRNFKSKDFGYKSWKDLFFDLECLDCKIEGLSTVLVRLNNHKEQPYRNRNQSIDLSQAITIQNKEITLGEIKKAFSINGKKFDKSQRFDITSSLKIDYSSENFKELYKIIENYFGIKTK